MGENSAVLTQSLCRNCANAVSFNIMADNMWYVHCKSTGEDTLPLNDCKYFEEE